MLNEPLAHQGVSLTRNPDALLDSDVKGVVETSLNVGVVTMEQDSAEIICLIRSLIDTGKDWVVETPDFAGCAGRGETAPKGGYYRWQPDADSPSWR